MVEYAVERPNQRPMIIITPDKKIFFTEDVHHRVWILEYQSDLQLQKWKKL